MEELRTVWGLLTSKYIRSVSFLVFSPRKTNEIRFSIVLSLPFIQVRNLKNQKFLMCESPPQKRKWKIWLGSLFLWADQPLSHNLFSRLPTALLPILPYSTSSNSTIQRFIHKPGLQKKQKPRIFHIYYGIGVLVSFLLVLSHVLFRVKFVLILSCCYAYFIAYVDSNTLCNNIGGGITSNTATGNYHFFCFHFLYSIIIFRMRKQYIDRKSFIHCIIVFFSFFFSVCIL